MNKMAKEGSRQNQLILDQGVALERQVGGWDFRRLNGHNEAMAKKVCGRP